MGSALLILVIGCIVGFVVCLPIILFIRAVFITVDYCNDRADIRAEMHPDGDTINNVLNVDARSISLSVDTDKYNKILDGFPMKE